MSSGCRQGIAIIPIALKKRYDGDIMFVSDAPTTITKARALALMQAPDECTVTKVLDAARAGDGEGACARALARAMCGEPVTAEVMAAVLPDVVDIVPFAALISVARGDRASALLELVERSRIPFHTTSDARSVLALHAAFRFAENRDDIAHRVVAQARLIARRTTASATATLLVALAEQISDPHLLAAVRRLRAFSYPPPMAASLISMLDRPLADAIAELPAEAPSPRIVAGFTVRTGPKVGRNEPCPCGSGKKYKRCHAELDASTARPSPVPSLSWDEYLVEGASRMTADDIMQLAPRDLMRVDLGRLPDHALIASLRRFVAGRRWELAGRAADRLAAREHFDADGHRADLIAEALHCGELDVAREQMAKLGDVSALSPGQQLELALHERDPDALERLLAVAMAAVAADDGGAAIDLAFALLRAAPALGLLVARGCLRPDRPLDSEVLLETIEEARDGLNLPAGDPAWDVYAAQCEEADASDTIEEVANERATLAREAERVRGELRAASARLRELEGELGQNRQALEEADVPRAQERAVPSPTSVSAPATETAQQRALREKVDELKALIRAGNEERLDLRRSLADATAQGRTSAALQSPAVPPGGTEHGSDDDMATPLADNHQRRVRVPVFERRAADAIDTIPGHVYAEAVRNAGALAAGDAAIWRSVKQAKDTPVPVLMSRVGIHHRMLFRIDADHLRVIDIVTRESLRTVLKRLRDG